MQCQSTIRIPIEALCPKNSTVAVSSASEGRCEHDFGIAKNWNHLIVIEAQADGRTACRDEADVKAGRLSRPLGRVTASTLRKGKRAPRPYIVFTRTNA